MADLPPDLLEDLKRDEGYSPTLYKDTEDKWTIGYGTLIQDGVYQEEAEFMLNFRAKLLYNELLEACPFVATAPASIQNALANMYYNLGRNRFLGFKKMLSAIEIRDYPKAAQEALDSKWATQVGDRAKRIASILEEA